MLPLTNACEKGEGDFKKKEGKGGANDFSFACPVLIGCYMQLVMPSKKSGMTFFRDVVVLHKVRPVAHNVTHKLNTVFSWRKVIFTKLILSVCAFFCSNENTVLSLCVMLCTR